VLLLLVLDPPHATEAHLAVTEERKMARSEALVGGGSEGSSCSRGDIAEEQGDEEGEEA